MIIPVDLSGVNRYQGGVAFKFTMPTKKQSLFEISGSEPAKEKAPTLKQFIKTLKDVDFPYVARVTVIWFPGNWDNYSVETNAFRASIAPNHPLYELLDRDVIAVTEGSHTGLALSIEDANGTIRFCETTNQGEWKRIGNSGIRFWAYDESKPSEY